MELLNEILTIKEIDLISTKVNNKWVKVKNKLFEKVSRIFAISRNSELEITLDINSEIYSVQDEDVIELKIVCIDPEEKNLNNNNQNWLECFDKNLIDLFEYVMYGTIFHCGIEDKNFFIYGSFGGLLIKIFGKLQSICNHNFSVDSKILLLIRKL